MTPVGQRREVASRAWRRPTSARGGQVADEREPAVRRVELEAGRMVFHQGDAADLVYIVEEGAVEIFRVRPDGTEDQLATITPGHYFGEIGPLLASPAQPRPARFKPSRLTGLGPARVSVPGAARAARRKPIGV